MTTTKVHTGYVITESGQVFLQMPADNQFGFSLFDDDQSWDGGVGLGTWTAIKEDDPRITDADRERLAWLLEQ